MPSNLNEPKKLNRICFLNPHGYVTYPPPLGKTDTGGQTLYEFQLAKALGKKNIKVDIVTRKFNGYPNEEDVFENVRIIRIPCNGENFVSKEKMFEHMPEMVENLMKHMEKTRKKYDLVHSHYWDGGYAGILMAKMLDIPHAHTPHTLGKAKKMEMSEDAPIQKLKPYYRYHVRIAIEQKIINSADAIVVLCETSRIQILQHYIADFEKLHVIFPGVDTEYFNTKKNAWDKKINFHPNSILTTSRIVPAKGLDRLVDALALLKNKVNYHLYLGGGTPEADRSEEERLAVENIQSIIKRNKMEKKVTFLGRLEHDTELPSYYRSAKIFVNPSRYEPFGLTTIEAMACGTVPMISAVAGSREVIIDGLNGFIVKARERKILADTILKVLQDSKLQKKISNNAAFTVQEHYSWDRIVEEFITLYKRLL